MVSHPIRNLLKGLIDYAGLFPPAKLEMAFAAEEYAQQRQSEHAFMLDRFVIPVARLKELDKVREQRREKDVWPLSVLVGAGSLAEERLLLEKLERGGRFVVPSVEAKCETLATPEKLVRAFPGREVYCEVPLDGDISPWLDAVLQCGGRAKIRTGGITQGAIPSIAEVARFLFAAAAVRLPFKATAGLHHPLRGDYALTYDDGSPYGTLHGFLNVFLAAAFLRQGEIDETQARELLAETRPSALEWSNAGVMWSGARLTSEEIAEARTGFALSYGSCSFEEPLADLRRLHLL